MLASVPCAAPGARTLVELLACTAVASGRMLQATPAQLSSASAAPPTTHAHAARSCSCSGGTCTCSCAASSEGPRSAQPPPAALRRSLLPSLPAGSLPCGAARMPCAPAALRGMQTAAQAAVPAPPDQDLWVALAAAGLFDEAKRAQLTPSAIVEALDKHIVGQAQAKRAVAVAMRNRWRRQRVEPAAFRDEIMPKNILMVGPTGCGKTEIARRLAKLADAPFIKVEATKFTELGYVGRDVDEIVKDLVEAALALVRAKAKERLATQAAARAEAAIVRGLVGPHAGEDTVASFRELYRKGALDDKFVEVDAALLDGPAGQNGFPGGAGPFGPNAANPFGPGGIIHLDRIYQKPPGGAPGPGGFPGMAGPAGMGGGPGGGPFAAPPGGAGGPGGARPGAGGGPRRNIKVSEARQRIQEAESERLLSSEQLTREAVRAAEQDGIVFLDEIDKIVENSSGRVVSGGVSSEGVQRDLLPIIEGSVVSTKHGNVSTDHVLFICAGAFHSAKPSDMLAELQGRLPIRVELQGLSADDFYRILTEPTNNMIRQQQELLATEHVRLAFTDGAVRACARVAEEANRLLDNIGARRLYTILERVLADVSFSAPSRVAEARKEGKDGYEFVVDEAYVMERVGPLLKKQDLSRYVL